ncbi:HAD family hydrolase [Peterkaempfera griseoplana]|uniref:HAD family hydrolase n=1 Tax=Peterkaempfera griseoplana TaxID=66896 RepID=UPI0006E35772|nr:HAD-IA family hydrolase [Peterkaempfera griseoplana]
MGALPYDAVLCDLDGVLRLWDDHMTGLDRAHGLPAGTLAGGAFRPERLQPAITGRVTDQQWRAAVAEDLAGVCGSADRARALCAAWAQQTGRVDHEVLTLLTAVRRRVPVVLVTNATTRLESDLAALGLTGALDAVVNSARIGVAKPDPEVFRIAARRAGVPVRRCLFVDDTESNTAAARALGMAVLHYRRADGLRAALAPLTAAPAAGL